MQESKQSDSDHPCSGRYKVVKVLVVFEDTDEKSSSRALEAALQQHLKFHCIFQVVPDSVFAFEITRSTCYDIIMIPQKMNVSFSAMTLMDILRNADGCAPPFIFLLDRDEMPRRIKGSMSKYIRYTPSGNIPLAELSEVITSCIVRAALLNGTAMPEAMRQRESPVHVTPVNRDSQRNVIPTMQIPYTSTAAHRFIPTVTAESAISSPECSKHSSTQAKRQRRAEHQSASPLPLNILDKIPIPAHEVSESLDQQWALMQMQASHRFQQQFSPPVTRPQPNHQTPAPPASPARPARGQAPSPPLTAYQQANPIRYSTESTVQGMGMSVNMGMSDTRVDPEVMRILTSSHAAALDVEEEPLHDVFSD